MSADGLGMSLKKMKKPLLIDLEKKSRSGTGKLPQKGVASVNGKSILLWGNPKLVIPTSAVAEWSKQVHLEVQTVAEVLNNTGNAVAVAANQVGYTHSFFVYRDTGGNHRLVLNPEFIYGENVVLDVEGCLSFPGVGAIVPRYESIRVSYITFPSLTEVTKEYTGFDARMFQHEMEHLEGGLFIDDLTEDAKNEFIERYRASLRNSRPGKKAGR